MVNSLINVMVQVEIFKKFRELIFRRNGKAKPCSDEIYEQLAEELKGMTKKSINRHVHLIICRVTL